MRLPKRAIKQAAIPKTGLPRRQPMNPQQMANKLAAQKKTKKRSFKKGVAVGVGGSYAWGRGIRSENKGRAPSK